MATRNDITGAEIKSKILSKEGRDNWDKIFPPKKSAYEWEKESLVKIIDPDGWRLNDGVTMETRITREEFDRRARMCTCTAPTK